MFYLNVPYPEKDIAYSLGARWDGKVGRWYVPIGVDIEFFFKWVAPEDLAEAKKLNEQQQPEKGIKLSNLLMKVKKAVDDNMSETFWVHAEIANLQFKGSTLYLQLAETDVKGNQVCNNRAIIWDQNLPWIQKKFKGETGQDFQKGIKVLLKVKLEYTVKFQLSIVVLDIDPSFTLGGIESKIKQLRDKVTTLGLYEKNKKLKNPVYFKKVAVVSPQEAAGLGDFKADADMLEKHNICSFKYYTATFQGDKTNKTVSAAIQKASFDSLKENYDVIVVIRGGGAKTDLHYLNEFDILKQVADSKIPVFVGIGHEQDRVLIDEVANRTFDTPSKVIAHISSNNIAFYKKLNQTYDNAIVLQEKIVKQYKTVLDAKVVEIKSSAENIYLRNKDIINFSSNKINELALIKKSNFRISLEELNSIFSMKSMSMIKKAQSDLVLVYNKIENSKKTLVSNYKTNLNVSVSEVAMRSPLNALDNGYAIIKKKNGDILINIENLEKEKTFIIMMKDGEKEFKTGDKK